MAKPQESKGQDVLVIGRIVWTCGDIFKGREKIDQNDPLKRPKLNKEGKVIQEYGFGLAVAKGALSDTTENGAAAFWQALHGQAYEIYPSQQMPPGFGWKYKDGDGIDHNGEAFAKRDGHAGCLVFALTSTWQPQFFKKVNGQYIQINEGIKCGDYVQVQVNIVAHGAEGNMKAGMYLNPRAVQFLGYGEEIINRPSASDIFGNREVALPNGASATPLGGNQMMLPPAQHQPQPQVGYNTGVPNMAPQGVPMQQPGFPQPGVDPYYNVLPAQHQPQPQVGYNTGVPNMAPQGVPMQQPGFPQPGVPNTAPQGVPGFPAPTGFPVR